MRRWHRSRRSIKASVVLMHIKGTPKTMQMNPSYKNVTEDVKQFLRERLEAAMNTGIKQIIIDPGIGFGKKYEHNIQLLKELNLYIPWISFIGWSIEKNIYWCNFKFTAERTSRRNSRRCDSIYLEWRQHRPCARCKRNENV